MAISGLTKYLSDRNSSIKIYNYLSYPSPMKYRGHQRSVNIPSLFSVYLYPLTSIISKYS